MRKDITKKFLMAEDRYMGIILSKDICNFIFKKRMNIDAKQIGYDEVCFRNVFSTQFIGTWNPKNIEISGCKLRNIVEKNGKTIEFNMIYCKGDEFNSKFVLGETEITQELYRFVMDRNPSHFKEGDDSKQRPVENVTWYDAIMFCNKLSELQGKNPYYEIKDIGYGEIGYYNDGKSIQTANIKINEGANGFRLPLSKEWENAARAGTNNQYAGTSDENKLGEYAWFVGNSGYKTHPVATKKPNEWGFYDMTGNVNEWCYDLYSNNSNKRAILGGGYGYDSALYLHSAHRRYFLPRVRGGSVGFRVSASF